MPRWVCSADMLKDYGATSLTRWWLRMRSTFLNAGQPRPVPLSRRWSPSVQPNLGPRLSHVPSWLIALRFRCPTRSGTSKKVTRISNPPRKIGTISDQLRPSAATRKSVSTESAAGGSTPVRMSPIPAVEFQDRRDRPLCHPFVLLSSRHLRVAEISENRTCPDANANKISCAGVKWLPSSQRTNQKNTIATVVGASAPSRRPSGLMPSSANTFAS